MTQELASSDWTARAPAKVILTGEHSVVYGKPAIITAVNRFAYTEILPNTSNTTISLNLLDFKQKASSTIRTLRLLKERLLESYHLCLKGELTIRQVLQKPAELFQFAFISLLDTFQMEIQKGLHIHLRSDIPIGCGMGSSAATIVSVIRALAHFLKIEIKPEWLYRLSVEAERLQHGYSSGVDSYISLNGGCAKFERGNAKPLILPNFPLYIVNTGRPDTTTGECVMQVAKDFSKSLLWDEFETIALELEQALLSNDLEKIKSSIKENHRLLVSIGVVPTKAMQFIQEIETLGFAAKICGAGATSGNSCGIILVIANQPPEFLCQKYGYTLTLVQGEAHGAHLR